MKRESYMKKSKKNKTLKQKTKNTKQKLVKNKTKNKKKFIKNI